MNSKSAYSTLADIILEIDVPRHLQATKLGSFISTFDRSIRRSLAVMINDGPLFELYLVDQDLTLSSVYDVLFGSATAPHASEPIFPSLEWSVRPLAPRYGLHIPGFRLDDVHYLQFTANLQIGRVFSEHRIWSNAKKTAIVLTLIAGSMVPTYIHTAHKSNELISTYAYQDENKTGIAVFKHLEPMHELPSNYESIPDDPPMRGNPYRLPTHTPIICASPDWPPCLPIVDIRIHMPK